VRRRFLLTPQAKTDLREMLSDIAEDSPDAAERPRSETHDAFLRLGKSPGIGHYHEELLDRRYRFWNFYSYVVCCVWEKTPIQIIAVVHGARDLAWFFASRLSTERENPQESLIPCELTRSTSRLE
jgi:plasmid stabilization system protein ParE